MIACFDQSSAQWCYLHQPEGFVLRLDLDCLFADMHIRDCMKVNLSYKWPIA